MAAVPKCSIELLLSARTLALLLEHSITAVLLLLNHIFLLKSLLLTLFSDELINKNLYYDKLSSCSSSKLQIKVGAGSLKHSHIS